MDESGTTDPGRKIDWGKTSEDYQVFRPGYPDSFWKIIDEINLGGEGQIVLDLATGTGVMARQFAVKGATVTGVDIATEQIEAAQNLAAEQGLTITFIKNPAEASGMPDSSCDLISAAQCFLYFDKAKVISEIKRILKPGGRLLTSYLSWLPFEDPIVAATEELVLKHNPEWTGGGWRGNSVEAEKWSIDEFQVLQRIDYKEKLPFTVASWCGRIRACRGIGATLSPEEVVAFDKEHAAMLRKIAGEEFEILHQIEAFVYESI